eukprot:11173099-Lingulodinium_polyedra.AAC.1
MTQGEEPGLTGFCPEDQPRSQEAAQPTPLCLSPGIGLMAVPQNGQVCCQCVEALRAEGGPSGFAVRLASEPLE